MEKIKFKKIIFNLVETIGNDMELGQKVRNATKEYLSYKKSKEEGKSLKNEKTKLPKVDKNKIDNYSKNKKLKPNTEPSILK